jgi:hypothetical protein
MLTETLQFLHKNDFLKKTILVLLSDHGMRWGGIRNTIQGRLEERMPMNFWIFPQWFSEKYASAVAEFRKNAQKLTTPFDVHETLKNILEMDAVNQRSRQQSKITRGISLFRPIPNNRTCESAAIAEHWCVCSGMEKIFDKNLTLVKTGAKFVLVTLNDLLRNELHCAKLKLKGIRNVSKRTVNDGQKFLHLNETVLQITLITEPGEAIFEATVAVSKTEHGYQWKLVGEISRLNLYGSQSWCISDFVLRKYCFCLKNPNGTLDSNQPL